MVCADWPQWSLLTWLSQALESGGVEAGAMKASSWYLVCLVSGLDGQHRTQPSLELPLLGGFGFTKQCDYLTEVTLRFASFVTPEP